MKKLLPLLLLALLACPPAKPADGPDRPVVPPDSDKCADACDHLKVLGCEEATGSDPNDPLSCKKDCEYVQANGLNVSPACWITIQRCDELETKCKDN